MPITKFPLKTSHLSLYLEESKGIVYHKISHNLYHLPTLSIAILFSIDEGQNQQSIINSIAKEYQLSKQLLEPIYHQINTLFSSPKQQGIYLAGRYPEFEASPKQVKLINHIQVAYFQVADTIFSIDTKDEDLFIAIQALLSPCRCSSIKVDFVISIAISDDNYQIFSNGLLVETDLSFNHVMPLIIDRLQILSFQKSDYTFCFHGAALGTPRGTLLLPGKSGSGKSTLSAVLAGVDGGLFSDEIIAFNKNFELCLLSLPIAVKSGSWKSLDIQYPNLKHMPTWHRLDGRRLKYVWPNDKQANKTISKNDNAKFLLINPKFVTQPSNAQEAQPQAVAKPLDVIDTIAMLTDSGYQLGFELTESGFEAFLNFIEKTPCYQLSYSSSQQALDKLDELWLLQ
jgi:hypothetical protein